MVVRGDWGIGMVGRMGKEGEWGGKIEWVGERRGWVWMERRVGGGGARVRWSWSCGGESG